MVLCKVYESVPSQPSPPLAEPKSGGKFSRANKKTLPKTTPQAYEKLDCKIPRAIRTPRPPLPQRWVGKTFLLTKRAIFLPNNLSGFETSGFFGEKSRSGVGRKSKSPLLKGGVSFIRLRSRKVWGGSRESKYPLPPKGRGQPRLGGGSQKSL